MRRFSCPHAAWVFCVVLASSMPSFAQEGLPPTVQAVLDSTVAPAMERIPGEPLRLDDAVAAALAQAPRLRIARAQVEEAAGALRSAGGDFDPTLFASIERASDDQPSASFFAGADVLETRTTEAEAGARLTLPVGTEIEARVSALRAETNSSFAALDPQYDTLADLSLRQPLLDGRGVGTGAVLAAAEVALEAARARAEDVRLAVVADVESIYWQLFASGRDFAVQEAIVAQAEAVLEEARARADAGLAGPSAVANARVFLAEQRQIRFDRLESMGLLSDRLASLTGRRPEGDDRLFRPSDAPPDRFTVLDVEDLVDRALAGNPSLRAAERDLAVVEERLRAARRNALPTLDLLAGIGGRGLGGDPQAVEFGGDVFTSSVDGGLGDGLEQALTGDFPNWRVGLSLEIPLGNRRDGGERDRLEAERTRVAQSLESARRALEESVRAQHRVLENGAARLAAAHDGVDAANEQVRIGVLEFQNGRTRAFELVRLGADLTRAQQRYSDALVRTARATAQLRRLLGGDSPLAHAPASDVEESR